MEVAMRVASVVALLAFITACTHAQEAAGPQVTEFVMDSAVQQFEWSTNGVAWALSTGGTVYRSSNGGRQWSSQADKMAQSTVQIPEVGLSGAAAMYISRANPNNAIFRGRWNLHWSTSDGGETYQLIQAGFYFFTFSYHPTEPSWILAMQYSNECRISSQSQNSACHTQLYVSMDNGATWTVVATYVTQYEWGTQGAGIDPRRALITEFVQKSGNQFYLSQSAHRLSRSDTLNFISGSHELLYGAVGLLVSEDFMFAVTFTAGTIRFWISNNDGQTFAESEFPETLTTISQFTIMDMSTGVIFLNFYGAAQTAEGRNDWGTLYISDGSGLRYIVSLPVNYRAGAHRYNFRKVSGLDGTYLANALNLATNQRETLVTMDKGGYWQSIQGELGPMRLGYSSDTYQVSPHSSENAVGIVLATGNYGEAVATGSTFIKSFLSRDAGLNWKQILDFPAEFGIGYHGSIITMMNSVGVQNQFAYTFDEGSTTHFVNLTQSFSVREIEIEPATPTLDFIIYGARSDGAGVLVNVDYSSLNIRICEGVESPDTPGSDYELWSPHDTHLNGSCLLGRKEFHVRKRASIQCIDNSPPDSKKIVSNCVCTLTDLECDIGYYRLPNELACQPEPGGPPPPPCGVTTFGFQLVPGTSCIMTPEIEELLPIVEECTVTTQATVSSTVFAAQDMVSASNRGLKGSYNAIISTLVVIGVLAALFAAGAFAFFISRRK